MPIAAASREPFGWPLARLPTNLYTAASQEIFPRIPRGEGSEMRGRRKSKRKIKSRKMIKRKRRNKIKTGKCRTLWS
jgi:hypothetical protein